MSRMGNIFGTLHQILVLMQINITQMVLVRIPHNLGAFDKPGSIDFVKSAMRENFLQKAEKEQARDEEETPDGGEPAKKSINPLAAAIMKIKQAQAAKDDDDNFKA